MSKLKQTDTESTAIDATLLKLLEGSTRQEITLATVDGNVLLITAECHVIYCASFLQWEINDIKSAFHEDKPLRDHAESVYIAGSFQRSFLQHRRKADTNSELAFEAKTLSIQSKLGLTRIIGRQATDIVSKAMSILPSRLSIAVETRVASKDRGRKIGRAAKDWAKLNSHVLTLDMLTEIESANSDAAERLVTKESIIPKPILSELQAKGVPPAVAAFIVYAFRVLAVRPQAFAECRRAYVETLPLFFKQLERCQTVIKAQCLLLKQQYSVALTDPKVVGATFASLQPNFYHSSPTIFGIREIEELPSSDECWRRAHEILSPTRLTEATERKPLPTRTMQSLEKLCRVGPPVKIHSVDDLIERYGYSGVEIGNYVSSAESNLMQNWLAQATHDLRKVVGPSLVRLHRRGNLAIALGARGSGIHCAHYETATRVINLTKSRGDGSFAHEWGHFLDHFLDEQIHGFSKVFLSDRIVRDSGKELHPFAVQMKKIMDLITHEIVHVQIIGDLTPQRWLNKMTIEKALHRFKGDPQQAFDSLSKQYPRQFIHGPKAEENSNLLANSIVKWTGKRATIVAAYLRKSSYLQSAKLLRPYWYRPCELFARAFESYVEDTMLAKGSLNEFLVNHTRANYDLARSNPYPQGQQRKTINEAIKELLRVVNRENF